MRIISGKHKGFRFNPPKFFTSRPTTDQAKEALFNIVNNWYYFDDLSVLDLFGGTGNISLEFLSRGATDVTYIESSRRVSQYASKIFQEHNENTIKVVNGDVFQFLKSTARKYELIFADPPFDLEGLETLPDLVFENGVLAENGTLIIEHGKFTSFENHPKFTSVKNYGGVHFSIFEY